MNNNSEFVILFDSISDLDDLDKTASKNKSKIKPFFKKRKKIFKPILYTLAGVSLWLTTTIISIGGITNFGERALFEYIIAHQNNYDNI